MDLAGCRQLDADIAASMAAFTEQDLQQLDECYNAIDEQRIEITQTIANMKDESNTQEIMSALQTLASKEAFS